MTTPSTEAGRDAVEWCDWEDGFWQDEMRTRVLAIEAAASAAAIERVRAEAIARASYYDPNVSPRMFIPMHMLLAILDAETTK